MGGNRPDNPLFKMRRHGDRLLTWVDNYSYMHMPSLKQTLSILTVLWACNVQALDTITRNGNLLTGGLPLVAAGLSYYNGDTAGLIELVKSEAVTVGEVLLLKSAVRETRPDGSDNKSFPSNHTAIAFSAAQHIQMKGGWEYGLPAYIAASYVGYSRVEAKQHYWKDVAAGAATGALTTYYFTVPNSDRRLGMSWSGRAAQVHYQMPLK